MALIVCRHCGKKVSDTVETCIHCGGLIEEPVGQPEEMRTQEPVVQAEQETPTIYQYSGFSEERQLKLEKAFLDSDQWAYKYRHKEVELISFKSMIGWILVSLIWSTLLLGLAFAFLFDMRAYRADLVITALVGAGILFAISVIVNIVLSIVLKVRKKSNERLIYLKKYQKWLMEEKHVAYQPKFDKQQMQETFEMINLDRLTY
jgi:hypothetical protein